MTHRLSQTVVLTMLVAGIGMTAHAGNLERSALELFGATGEAVAAKICNNWVCVDEKVMTSTGYRGVEGYVTGIFPNGMVAVRCEGWVNSKTWQSKDVGRTYGCAYGLCIGDSVVTSDGIDGLITGLFPDGRVAVRHRSWIDSAVRMADTVAR